MYTALLFVHVVCAVIWVGGAFTIQLLAVLVSRSGDPAELARLMRYFELIGSRVFVPVATLLFIAGAAMTLQHGASGGPRSPFPSRCGSCPLSRARSISDPEPSGSANSSTPRDRRPKQVAP